MRSTSGFGAAVAALALAVTGCASHRLPPPVAEAPPPPLPPRPEPPAGMIATQAIPPVGPDGAYATINHGVDATEAMWNVRAALNVAALGCRGPEDAQRIANYNALLRSKAQQLNAAHAAIQARYRARYGKTWQDEHDRHNTRLYNYFAQTPAQAAFCAAAMQVGVEAAAIAPADYPAFATTALARLEATFTDFYSRYDSYRMALAAWDAAAAGKAGPPEVRLAYASVDGLIDWSPAVATVQVASR